LDITTVDPLKYGLVFERFLNPERISMPDIDIDFADDRREEVLEYVTNKYGRDNVAQIITFGTMAAKAAIRDVGRVSGMSYADVDRIAKLIPTKPGTKLADAIRETPELQSIYNQNEQAKRLINLALKLEGVVRHASTHACAVVISEDELTNHTPLQIAMKDGNALITQYSMKPIEKIGLLKMDFLGLKNLTILENTIKLIKKRHDEQFDLSKVSFADTKTFELLGEGRTVGVFQLESPGMRRYLRELKPTIFEDIVAMISLYRPGPMEWISDYIAGKYGKKKVTYVHPILEPILAPTYGIIVYQEQILEIAKQFAGFTMGEADVLRRAIGKKIKHELDAQKVKFIEGAVANNIDRAIAEKVFSFVEPFANYGFNKSHAVSYAFISYQTAYLKAHYPLEFMSALLTADQGNSDRVMVEIQECREMQIAVLPPSVNESDHDFTPTQQGAIRYAFKAIKNIGDGPIESIINTRAEKPFASFEDFIMRVDSECVNRKTLESLAKSGALDQLVERNTVLQNIDTILQFAKSTGNNMASNQIGLFGEMTDNSAIDHKISLAPAEPATTSQKLAWEKEYLGIYLSEHPLDNFRSQLDQFSKIASIKEKFEGKRIVVAGVVNEIKRISTRNNQTMLFVTVEDLTKSLEVIVFPKMYHSFAPIIVSDALIAVKGKISFKDSRDTNGYEPKLIADEVSLLTEYLKKNTKQQKPLTDNEEPAVIPKSISYCIFDNVKNRIVINIPADISREVMVQIHQLLEQHAGSTSVIFAIPVDREVKHLKLPTKISFSDELKQEIDNLIQEYASK
jgi:DNA polymerase-3 subunit alpha